MTTIREEEEQVPPRAMATVRRAGPNYPLIIGLLVLLGILGGILWALLSKPRPAPVALNTPTVAAPTVTAPTLPAAPAAPQAAAPDLGRVAVNFSTGSAAVPASALAGLQQVVVRIRNLPPGSVVEVGGHTDNTGNAAANMALSQRRAEAVRGILIRDGVAPASLTARGYGETQPVATNDTADGRLQNRSTELAVVNR